MARLLSKGIGVIVMTVVFAAGWLIHHPSAREVLLNPGERPPFGFVDVTEALGIDFKYQRPELDPKINGKRDMLYVGAGVAVADFNGDGWMDILFVNAAKGAKNQLYLNQAGTGGVGFRDAAAEWGIADTNAEGATVTPVVFDYDNDGLPDVYLARMGCSMLFRNLGNRFENVTAKSGLGDCRNSAGAVPVDVDGDGWLDLYVLRNWPAVDYFDVHFGHARLWTENFYQSQNGGNKTLYRNRGDGTFEDATLSRGGSDTGWTWDAGAADMLGDGRQELYLSNDFGPDAFFVAEHGGLHQADNRKVFGLLDRRPGMGVSFGDLEHDGRPHVYVSNQSTKYYNPRHGNFLWHFSKDGTAEDTAEKWNTFNCGGWSWGSAFADLDLDGKEDLYVAAGMITGEAGEEDYDQYEFVRRTGMTIPGIFLDIDQWPDLNEKTLGGGVSDCVFWNRGGVFRDVAFFTGITKAWDGRAVAMIDYDNSGAVDLVVTTRLGPPHLLRNTVARGKRWVEFALRGTRSNRDGAGARLTLTQEGQPPQYRWATAGRSGFLASSDPRIHFGLPVEAPVNVTIRWPSGQVDVHEKLRPGELHTLTETGGARGGVR